MSMTHTTLTFARQHIQVGLVGQLAKKKYTRCVRADKGGSGKGWARWVRPNIVYVDLYGGS